MWDRPGRKLRPWLPLAFNSRRETIGALSAAINSASFFDSAVFIKQHSINTQTLFPHRLINLIRFAINWQQSFIQLASARLPRSKAG